MNEFDALVIGGSFAGLSAAMQLARARRQVCVIDAGAPRNRFASASHGFFGLDGAAPLALMSQGRDKLLAYPNVRFVQASALSADGDAARGFTLKLDSGQTVSGRKLVLAFGLVDQLPELPGLRERWGVSVLHCPYCHGYEFGGERQLGVLQIAPMSVHQALLIADWGPTTLFLNGHDAPGTEALAKLQQRGVAIEAAPVVALEGAGQDLSGLRLADGRLAPLAGLYIATRTQMTSPLAEQLGCAFDDGPFGPVLRTDPASKLSSVPGIYAAGDIARVPHNATFASADGVLAGASLHQALVFEPLQPQ